ncbi:hypothetical protein TL16_g08389 [Triparma laevis f. inornata]|uniref:Uncharacterized protein n=2 Tax=Triparma laevis TaxID=1534972 RepID=A0A9W7F2S3_9STRA|nr:hypothetical protein TL16_g08389 [Triparma laevis f. inornata]GMI01495.1 hypothetical protein TrLO_g4937 [Triparma laevis f. longispina]
MSSLAELKKEEEDLVAKLAAVRTSITELESTPPPTSDTKEGKEEDEDVEKDWEGDVDAKIADYKSKGNSAFSKGEYEDAASFYTKCIIIIKKIDKQEDPAYTSIYANRSATYLATKKWVKASWDAQCSAKCDPKFWKSHWRHGVSLMAMAPRIERSQNAVEAFERCLGVCPEEKKGEVGEALERARIRLQEGKDRTPMPPQCQQS